MACTSSDWLTLREIGWRATVAAVSDLAAMAAAPLGMLVALVLPELDAARVGELADGIGEAARHAQIPIVGGDLSRGDLLSIGVTVIGSAPSPVSRRGARNGDLIYVTGRLGGPGAALRAFQLGVSPEHEYRERFARPVPRLAEGQWLARAGARALIDVSDGLASEVRHLAAASDVQIEIDLDRLPALRSVTPDQAALSGEEYELLAAAPSLDVESFERAFGIPLTAIGRVTEGKGGAPVTFTRGGRRVDLASGYEHFSS
ncbi:MAG: thiamine-phosphate kinase [Gemmatimonadaceae bacterium]